MDNKVENEILSIVKKLSDEVSDIKKDVAKLNTKFDNLEHKVDIMGEEQAHLVEIALELKQDQKDNVNMFKIIDGKLEILASKHSRLEAKTNAKISSLQTTSLRHSLQLSELNASI